MAKMGFNNDRERNRLQRAIEWSRWKMEVFRRNRTDFIEQMVGRYYGDPGGRDKVPVNLLELALNIYSRQVAARSPKVIVSTSQRGLAPTALNFELALNRLLEEIDYQATQQLWVLDAMLTMGILKVGITSQDAGEQIGFRTDAGQPFAMCVDFDDWVMDMTARSYEEVYYAGNRYRLPLEFVMESDEFRVPDRLRDRGVSPHHRGHNREGDKRISTIALGEFNDMEELEDTIELWDIWIPRENRLVTLMSDDLGGVIMEGIVKEVDWTNLPEEGPFHLLSFNDVPGHAMPLAPAAILYDLHMLANSIFRKLGRQADRQKRITGVRGSADADGNRVLNANDGDMIQMDDPSSVTEFQTGGIDQVNLAFLLNVKDMFFDFAGNLDALGGLSPQSRTLGQDQLLQSSASQRVSDMQDRVVVATRRVIQALANYLWNDPLIDMPLVKPVPGTDFTIPGRFSAETKEGDFVQYEIQIHPFSMQHSTPASKLQTLVGVFNNFVAPYVPLMERQGVGINFEELFELVSRYSDLPELDAILEASPSLGMEQQNGDRPLQSPSTTRTNVRVNQPGATRRNSEMVMSRLLQGIGVQASEREAATR